LRLSFGKRFREEFFENELERKRDEVVARERERVYMQPLSFFQISFGTRVLEKNGLITLYVSYD
jgi:hypothetical protein